MPIITYDTISLQPSGMLSEHSFPLPGNNRKVQFQFPDGCSSYELFLCIDGKLQKGAFRNNGPMATPISGIERLCPGPHSASVIVVDKRLIRLDNMEPRIPDLVLKWKDYRVTCRFQAHISATICCCDGANLAQSCHGGGLQNPEAAVRNTLGENFSQAASRILREAVEDGLLTPDNAANEVVRLNEEICAEAKDKTTKTYRWLRVDGILSSISVNSEELLVPVNQEAEDEKKKRDALFQLMLDQIGRSALTPEMPQLLEKYLNMKPDITDEEVFRFIGKMKELAWAIPPERLEHFFREGLEKMEGENRCAFLL